MSFIPVGIRPPRLSSAVTVPAASRRLRRPAGPATAELNLPPSVYLPTKGPQLMAERAFTGEQSPAIERQSVRKRAWAFPDPFVCSDVARQRCARNRSGEHNRMFSFNACAMDLQRGRMFMLYPRCNNRRKLPGFPRQRKVGQHILSFTDTRCSGTSFLQGFRK